LLVEKDAAILMPSETRSKPKIGLVVLSNKVSALSGTDIRNTDPANKVTPIKQLTRRSPRLLKANKFAIFF
jgi:hypothetical protein